MPLTSSLAGTWSITIFHTSATVSRAVIGDQDDEAALSPWKLVSDEKHFIKGQEKLYFDIAGVTQLDYLEPLQEVHIYQPGELSPRPHC